MNLPTLMIFTLLVALTAAAAMPTDINESNSSGFDLERVAVGDSSEQLSPMSPEKAKRRSLGQFLGSILERTPLRKLLPARCSHHHHDHDDDDYDDHHFNHHHQHDHHDHHYGHHGYGHHDHRTEPTTASTRSLSPTNTNVESTPTTTTSTTTPATITSSSTPRYNDPDNELTEDIDLRFGRAR